MGVDIIAIGECFKGLIAQAAAFCRLKVHGRERKRHEWSTDAC